MVEAHVIFRGHVQGVFFRSTARDIAEEMGLAGTVQNLPDGTVELVVQGRKDNIESLVKRLKLKYELSPSNSVALTLRRVTKPISGFKIIH